MPQATLTSKGQITVPKPIREHLKLQAGDRLVFLVGADGTVNIKPLTAPVTILKGIVPKPDRPVSIEDMNRAIRSRGGGIEGD